MCEQSVTNTLIASIDKYNITKLQIKEGLTSIHLRYVIIKCKIALGNNRWELPWTVLPRDS